MSDLRLTAAQLRTLTSLAGGGDLDLTLLANPGCAGPLIAVDVGERYLVTRDGDVVREEHSVDWDREVVR